MVTMCPRRVALMWSTIAARLVDLPEPVGPVTSVSPLGWDTASLSEGGSPRLSQLGTSLGITRKDAPSPP